MDTTKNQTLTKSADQLLPLTESLSENKKMPLLATNRRATSRATMRSIFTNGGWIRITDEGMTTNSANKDLIHFSDVVKTANQFTSTKDANLLWYVKRRLINEHQPSL